MIADACNKGEGSDSFGCDEMDSIRGSVVNNEDGKRNVASDGGQWNQDQQPSFLANLHAIHVFQWPRRFSLQQEQKSSLESRRHGGFYSCQPPSPHSFRKEVLGHLGDPSLAFFV